jgi:2-hydroxyglutarate dehydrogenase
MFQKNGGDIKLNFEADTFANSSDPDYPIRIVSKTNVNVNTRYMIVCAGLQSDIMANKSGCDTYPKIVPFRGDYLVLKPEKSNLVRGNIYPVRTRK